MKVATPLMRHIDKKIPKRFHVIIGASSGGHVRSMSHSHTPNPRYESAATRVARDSEMVVKVTAAVEMHPFTAETTNLINM